MICGTPPNVFRLSRSRRTHHALPGVRSTRIGTFDGVNGEGTSGGVVTAPVNGCTDRLVRAGLARCFQCLREGLYDLMSVFRGDRPSFAVLVKLPACWG